MVRRILLLVTGVMVAFTLMLGGAALVFNEQDYKASLAWAADTFLDSTLEISGPLEMRIADGIRLHAGGLRLAGQDASYSLEVERLDTRFRLLSLFSGALLIHDIAVVNGHLRLNETPQAGGFDPADFALRPVLVERAQLTGLRIDYQELPPGTLQSFTLEQLVLARAADSERIEIRANGTIIGRHYEISGSLPPLAGMLEREQPHHLELAIRGDHISAGLEGTVRDLVKGRGMDIGVKFSMADARELIEVLGDDIPPLGDVVATARLRGDYDAPRLEDIDLRLQRGDEVSVAVTGTTGDLVTGQGLQLKIDGHSSRPAVASWLLFGKLGQMQSLALEAQLLQQDGHWLLRGVQAGAVTADGLQIAARGDMRLYDQGHVFDEDDQGLALEFSAPSAAAARFPRTAAIAAPGRLQGTARLLLSRDAVGVFAADVRVGEKAAQQSLLRGSIARIDLQDQNRVTGIDLQSTLQTPDVSNLVREFGYQLPPLGSGKAELRIRGDLDELRIDRIKISTTDKHGLRFQATGEIKGLNLPAGSLPAQGDFDISASIPQLADLSRYIDADLPALGNTRLDGKLRLRDARLLFEPARVNIGAADQPMVRLDGKVTTILRKGSKIEVSFDVAATDLLMAFIASKPGYLGRLHGTTSLSNMDGSWGIEQFQLSSTQTRLYQLEVGGGYADFRNTDLVNVKATFSVRDPAALGEALHLDFTGMGPWKTQGVLTSKAGRVSYKGSGSYGATTSSTVIDGSLRDGRPQLNGKVEIPVLYLKDFGIGQRAPADPDSRTDSNYVFSREPVDMSFLNGFDLDLQLLIDQVDSGRQLTINQVVGQLQLQKGVMKLAPLKLVFESGETDILFDADFRGVPGYRLQADADDLVLGPLLAQVRKDVPVNGYCSVSLDLSARGRSAHDLVASLGGSASLALENIRVPSDYVELLSVDVFGWAVSKTIKKEAYTNLDCLMMAYDVERGVMQSKLLIADGPSLSVGGSIKLDLGAETVDAVLIPKQKRRIFSRMEPVKIRGPLADPKVEAVPLTGALQEAGAMTLLPGVVIPARILGKLWSLLDDKDKPGNGCATFQAVTETVQEQQ